MDQKDNQSRDGQGVPGPRHVVPILLVAVLGATLSFTGWFFVSSWEHRTAEFEFNARVSNFASALQNGITDSFEKIVALRALFESSSQVVSRQEFENFADRLLPGQRAILSVSWIPRVTRTEREEHEATAARDGFVGYRIKSVAADGSVSAAPEKDEYFPVYYTTEKHKTESVYGLDLADGGIREQPLRRARDGNLMAVSESITLQSGSDDRRGFFVLLPVYRLGFPHDTVEDRRRNLVGFVQVVFQTSAMIDTVLNGINTPATSVYIFGPLTQSSRPLIYIYPSGLRLDPKTSTTVSLLETGPHWSSDLAVADKRWRLVALPIYDRPMITHMRAWILLIAGIAITGIAVTFMQRLRRHARRLAVANQTVTELARTDALTGLANRRAFLDHLTALFAVSERSGAPFAVLYLDIDQFKDVNDTLGHPIGDELLKQIAERIKSCVRQTDLVARFGGDEFAVLQTDAPDALATGTLADKIVMALAAPYQINGNNVHVTVSVGVSRYSVELSGPEAILGQADGALYRAKDDGRNCFRFHSSVYEQQVRERVTIARELHDAIERSEFELYYQPQVEMATGRIVGVEALVRWNHPKRGVVPPSTFIPIAERTGSIIPLGKWIFNEACRQTKLWQDQAIAPNSVAVNFSAVQFKGKHDLESYIAETLTKFDISPDKMEIELTESVLMEVTQQRGNILMRLRERGLKIAIDDFGTGYSSLNYLTHYPVNRLKIAQQLVGRVDSECRNATVVRVAIQLARELGIEVIAEGVETEAQARFLTSAGCELGQGYYFGWPVSADFITELLRRGNVKTVEQLKGNKSLVAA